MDYGEYSFCGTITIKRVGASSVEEVSTDCNGITPDAMKLVADAFPTCWQYYGDNVRFS